MSSGDDEGDSSGVCSDGSVDVEGLEGLEGMQFGYSEERRSARAFRAFLRDAAAGGARMHLASFWDEFYARHPCVDAGFAWYAQWHDVAPLVGPLANGAAGTRVLVSGVGDDAQFCTGLAAAGYGSVAGVDFSLPALCQCRRYLTAAQRERQVALIGGDLLRLPFRRHAFDLVLDKGTLDAIISDGSAEAVERGVAALRSLRHVCTPEGALAVVTLLEDPVVAALVAFFLQVGRDPRSARVEGYADEMLVRAVPRAGGGGPDARRNGGKRPAFWVHFRRVASSVMCTCSHQPRPLEGATAELGLQHAVCCEMASGDGACRDGSSGDGGCMVRVFFGCPRQEEQQQQQEEQEHICICRDFRGTGGGSTRCMEGEDLESGDLVRAMIRKARDSVVHAGR
jgi:ubiquinone/menaquinone biosynthesis C-methylase UbiE